MAGVLAITTMSTPSGDDGKDGRSEAQWLDEIADMAEAFVGNTIVSIGSIELLIPDSEQSELHRKRLADLKARVETLESLLIECRKLSEQASRQT